MTIMKGNVSGCRSPGKVKGVRKTSIVRYGRMTYPNIVLIWKLMLPLRAQVLRTCIGTEVQFWS